MMVSYFKEIQRLFFVCVLALLHWEGNNKLVVCISNGGATLLVSTNPRENNDNS